MLTGAQLRQYREEGFLALPQFYDEAQTRALQQEVERLQADGLLRDVSTDERQSNLQLVATWKHSQLLRDVPFHPRLRALVSQVVGTPAFLYFDQIFLKPARHGAGTSWHQDNDYFKLRNPMDGVAVWTAVHAATAENGTMRFIPGSHRQALPHSRDPLSDHHVRCYPDEARARLTELPAGGVVIFTFNTAHATGPNHTDRTRAGFALHFASVEGARDAGIHHGRDGRPLEYIPGTPGRPLISGPEFSRGMSEYGIDSCARWS
jgi:ectoine hydroxylase-related dioxygenase (phytanoyl-CoA dioxygenase family)